MPEIGEVRIIAKGLADILVGKWLVKIELLTGFKKFKQREELNGLLPLNVTNVKTRGKFSWIELKGRGEAEGCAVGYGLGMSGNFRREPSDYILADYNARSGKKETISSYLKHAHLRLSYSEIENGPITGCVYYHDIRSFGNWSLYLNKAELQKKLDKMGVDLIDNDLTDVQILKCFRNCNHLNICKVLMNQEKILAGIGNYLKAEALYAAKIWPLAIIKNIPDQTLLQMYHYVRNLAKAAEASGGASFYTYTGINGDRSKFKFELKVYNNQFDPLGNLVEKLPDKVSPDRRTTHWVSSIQTIGKPEATKVVLKTDTPKVLTKVVLKTN